MDEARKKNMYLMKQYQSNLRKDSVKMLGTPRQNIVSVYTTELYTVRTIPVCISLLPSPSLPLYVGGVDIELPSKNGRE